MEPAKIDWKNLQWRFVQDDLYEHFNAPKWFDFLSSDSLQFSNDDEDWFCRPDCNHPKTAQDFLKSPTPSKFASPSGASEISPFGNRNQRDMKLKRRGLAQAWMSPIRSFKNSQDSENQNPNQSTPPINPNQQGKILKAAIKSSAEKNEAATDEAVLPRLKSTLSSRNLFAGRDILGQISEFCNELKRMATKPRERDNNSEELERCKVEVLGENKPLIKEKAHQGRGVLQEKQIRVNKTKETENIPISVNLENMKLKDEKLLMQIRTNPPSPQCFSATKKAIPSSKSKLMEGGILQENNKQALLVVKKEAESVDKNKSVSIVESREAKTLDVFWFLKPCTLSSTYTNT